MFDSLQSKLQNAFKRIRGHSVIRPEDIELTMKEVKSALLEADVNFKVAKDFCARVGEKALGESVLKSLTPDQQIIKVVHEELIETMGREAATLQLNVSPPFVIMLVGLQGSGKTTTSSKLARLIRDEFKKRVLLVPADTYRLAAVEQLKTLGRSLGIDVFDSGEVKDPVEISKNAYEHAKSKMYDCIIIDTAGRLQVDSELMQELQEISAAVEPHEILLVADCMTGQEAVNVAKGFDQALEIDGLILTKLDGDARGGAALSMRAVTGKPIKFVGLGEKSDALEIFHPDRMASRILGMGDMMSLIEKAVKNVDLEETADLHKKLKKNEFSFEDFLSQLKMIKKMGSISSLISMMPGMDAISKKVDPEAAEKEMKHLEAIILSMTKKERRNPSIIDGSRRRRIAKGSGRTVEEVNRLLKQFLEMKKVMSKLSKGGLGGLTSMLGGKGLGALQGLMRR